jgi:uncharacterized membrane protein
VRIGATLSPVATVSQRRLTWLTDQLDQWRSDGLISDEAAGAIRVRYTADRRYSLLNLILVLGAAFLSVGIVWLVATNVDRISPLGRFAAVLALWIGLVVAAEATAARRAREGLGASPVVAALRLIAAAAFGAVVFQAAQSVQVPAYDAALLGWFGLGALLYAYVTLARLAVGLGVALSAAWFVWACVERAVGVDTLVWSALVAAAAAGAIGVLHATQWRAELAPAWRLAGALLALFGLFVVSLPFEGDRGQAWSAVLIVGAVIAGLAVIAALVRAGTLDRIEAAIPVLVLACAVPLALAETDGFDGSSAQVTPRAVLGVLLYLAVAGWYAALGVLRDLPVLTWVATAALVLFTTVQSFAVFAPIISGAALFLVLGVVLLASGFVVDRGRRRLLRSVGGAR